MLPASEEAFESGSEERTSTLKQALGGSTVLNSHLATRVLAAYFFSRAADLDTQPTTDDGYSGGGEDDEYWVKQQDVENDLLSAVVRLQPNLRLPQNPSCPHAIFINILIHTATMCRHKSAIRKARGREGPDDEFHRRQGRSGMFAAAAQILAIFRLTENLVVTLRNPIQDYAAQMLAGQLTAELERLGTPMTGPSEVRSPLTLSCLFVVSIEFSVTAGRYRCCRPRR